MHPPHKCTTYSWTKLEVTSLPPPPKKTYNKSLINLPIFDPKPALKADNVTYFLILTDIYLQKPQSVYYTDYKMTSSTICNFL